MNGLFTKISLHVCQMRSAGLLIALCVCYIKGQILTDYRALSGLYWGTFDAYNELTTEEL